MGSKIAVNDIELFEMLECHENLVDKVRDLIPVDFFAGNHLM